MKSLKVYVADDHALFRGALVKLLQDFKRVKETKAAADGKELLDLVRNDIPDVVILDLEMPVWDGSKTCKKISGEFPEVKIIIVSMHDSKAYITSLLQTGAHAFLSKNADSEELEAAIYPLVDTGIYLNKIMQDAMRQEIKLDKIAIPKKAMSDWSSREQTVIQLLCKGLTNKQIGYELSLSENTVRNHKVRIMKKASVKNALELVKFAFQNGIIEQI